MMQMGCHMQDSVTAAVDNFMYLGSIITNDGEIVNEVIVRLQEHLDACDSPSLMTGVSVCRLRHAVVIST